MQPPPSTLALRKTDMPWAKRAASFSGVVTRALDILIPQITWQRLYFSLTEFTDSLYLRLLDPYIFRAGVEKQRTKGVTARDRISV